MPRADAVDVAPVEPRYARLPTNHEMITFLARLAGRFVWWKLEWLLARDQWFVAYTSRGRRSESRDVSSYQFTCLQSPRDRFWADPFPVEVDGACFVFVEEFVHQTGKQANFIFFDGHAKSKKWISTLYPLTQNNWQPDEPNPDPNNRHIKSPNAGTACD